MLPDFLKMKEKLKKMIISERKKALLRHMGPFADIPQSILFEGNKAILIREDGSREEVKMEKAEVKMEIKLEEAEEMTHERVLDKIDTMAREMAGKKAKSVSELISKAAEKAGNVTSLDGKPLTIDVLLDEIEKMPLSLDEEGQPSGLRFAAGSKLTPSLNKIMSQLKSHPRYQKLIEQKREEWRVRENRRKLVG